MKEIINYIFEGNLCLLLFLVAYRLIFRKENSFQLMRYVVLVAIVLSFILPLLHFNHVTTGIIPSFMNMLPEHWLPAISISPTHSTSLTETEPNSIWSTITLAYFIGLGLTMVLTIVRIGKVFSILYRHECIRLGRIRLIESNEQDPTFSFFNWIFIGRADSLTAEEKDQIVKHEIVHAKQYHSLDILLVTFTGIIFWFNPFVKTFRNILVQLHEFEADEKAVANSDVNFYCSLLAKVALQKHFTIANHFSQSLTVKRIEMLRMLKRNFRRWKLIPLVIFVTGTFVIIACQDQFDIKKTTHGADERIFMVVEDNAEPVGGLVVLTDYLRANIRYSKKAIDNKIEGTVYVSFVVDNDGKLFDFKILRGVDEELDAEALRVVKTMPPWKPGRQNGVAIRQRFNLPIKFNSRCLECKF